MLKHSLGMLQLAWKEILGPSRVGRGPTPSSVLGEAGFLEAMIAGGRSRGRLASGFLFHSARITQMLHGRRVCVDIGCGDGTQTIQLAALNPGVRFVGIDHSQLLLDAAARLAAQEGVDNVAWICDRLPGLAATPDAAYDAVISTMMLHDLPDLDCVGRTLSTIRRIATSDAAFYLEDFARLKAASSIDFFLSLNAPPSPDRFLELYGLSLRAAHTLGELRKLLKENLPQVAVHVTAPIPFLLVAKTPDQTLDPVQRARIHALRGELSAVQRRDLDALRRTFALGGLNNDPFA